MLNKVSLLSRIKSGGFTMIELLIVIAILGLLAVAVLAALNPVEQINRGRDTGSKSDAEQLISAVDRYSAFVGYYPWQTKVDENTLVVPPTKISAIGSLKDNAATPCNVLDKLSSGTGACEGNDELKMSFVSRIVDQAYNSLTIYNRGQVGDATYVCFSPTSKAFKKEAKARCGDTSGTGLPADLKSALTAPTPLAICTADAELVCLP